MDAFQRIPSLVVQYLTQCSVLHLHRAYRCLKAVDVVCVGLVGLRIAERLLQVCARRGGREGERGEEGGER